MIAMITAALTIISVLLELWMQGAPERKKEAANEAIQKGRQNLVDGNTDAIESRIDSVCDDSNGSPAGLESAEDIERRISQL